MALALVAVGAPAIAQDWGYRVRPGDTLWDLSDAYLKPGIDWQRLQEHNRIADPYRLPPGLRLGIPLAWIKAQPASARVSALEGQATVQEGANAAARPLLAGARLSAGSIVRTLPGASLSLQFADGSHLRLREDSELVLDRLSRYGRSGMVDTRVRLQRGRISNDVRKLRGPGAQFIVDTPTASSAVRGTRFRVQAGAALTHAEVLEGRVTVKSGAATALLRPGFGAIAGDDAALHPLALLPAPDLSALASADANSTRIAWPAVTGATHYRVQISRSADFASLLLDQRIDTPALSVPTLPPGDYHVQVRGIDAQGLEGRDAQHALHLDGTPVPPYAIAPVADSVVREHRPRLQWTRAPQARAYRYEVTANVDFAEVVAAGTVSGDEAVTLPQDLPPGAYYWRAGSIDAQGKQGPFGDAIPFSIRPLDPIEDIDRLEGDGSRAVHFRWRAGQPGQRYRFQMSRTADFARVRVDEVVAQPEIRLDKLAGGTWYLRAQPVDDNGDVGAFAEPQQITLPCRLCRAGAGAAIIVLLLSL